MYGAKSQINRTEPGIQLISIGVNLTITHLKSFVFNMRTDFSAGPIMMKSATDIPYNNQVRMAHRAKNIVYRSGNAHKVHLVVPSAALPSPQSAMVQTLRPTLYRSNAYSNLRVACGRVESTDTKADSEATKSEDAETGYIENQTSTHAEHGGERYLQSQVRVSHEEDRPRGQSLRAADVDGSNSEDTLCENDYGTIVAPIRVRTHRALCAADFEDSDDEDSLCDDGDIGGLDLEANSRWSNCNKELSIPQEYQLTMVELRIQENVLREIVQQALNARRNGKVDSSIFSEEEPEEEDWVLEMILELMELGDSMADAGVFQREEGGDIQMMMRNNFHTLVRKATRPFRPSGIKLVKAELAQCVEAFRQTRMKLLEDNAGIAMEEILKDRSLDLRPQ